MTKLTRRAAMGVIATLPATGAIAAPTVEPENPIDKLNRIARDLSVALDEYNEWCGCLTFRSAVVRPRSAGASVAYSLF